MVRFNRFTARLTLVGILALFITGCRGRAKPIPGLYGIPIETSTPRPTAVPTPTPQMEPQIVITPQSGEVDPDARFILNVIVEDEHGQLHEATLTFTWLESHHVPMVIGPTADIKVPIKSSMSPFVLTVEKQGFAPVRRPFVVEVNEDVQYELIVVLVKSGVAAF